MDTDYESDWELPPGCRLVTAEEYLGLLERAGARVPVFVGGRMFFREVVVAGEAQHCVVGVDGLRYVLCVREFDALDGNERLLHHCFMVDDEFARVDVLLAGRAGSVCEAGVEVVDGALVGGEGDVELASAGEEDGCDGSAFVRCDVEDVVQVDVKVCLPSLMTRFIGFIACGSVARVVRGCKVFFVV